MFRLRCFFLPCNGAPEKFLLARFVTPKLESVSGCRISGLRCRCSDRVYDGIAYMPFSTGHVRRTHMRMIKRLDMRQRYTSTHAHTHAHIICTYITKHTSNVLYIYICIYIFVICRHIMIFYIYVCIHTHRHTHTHIYIYMVTKLST